MVFPIEIDATALTSSRFLIPGITGWLETKFVQHLQLDSGKYKFQIPVVGEPSWEFTVTTVGKIQYDNVYDVNNPGIPGFLAGEGTSKITFVGYGITLDARPLMEATIFYRLADVGESLRATESPHKVQLLPGKYQLELETGGIAGAMFEVTSGGKIQYESALDVSASPPGFLSKTDADKTLILEGYPITLDASPLKDATLLFRLNVSGWLRTEEAPHKVRLMPGTYHLGLQNGEINGAFFEVLFGGKIQYDNALDVSASSPGFLRKTDADKTLILQGYPITLDASLLKGTTIFFSLVSISGWLYTADSPQSVHLLPGTYQLGLQSGAIAGAFFEVKFGGKIHYDDALDASSGSTQGMFRGRGSARLEWVGYVAVREDSTRFWLRLEPCSTNENFEGGLHAAIHDPLWMLGRQWQLGEFQLEDAASPVHAELVMNCTPLTRYSFGTEDMKSLPLETLVEREAVRVSGKFQLRLAAEAGLQFLRILESRGGTQMMRKAIVEKFPLPPPDKELLKARDPNIDHNTINFLRVMFSRAPDGESIYRLVQDTQARQTWLHSFQQAERTLLEKTIPIWIKWYETLFSEPDSNDSAWRPNRLEYSFDVATKIADKDADKEVVLTAPEYSGGHLDWYSFNIRQAGTLGAPPGVTESITRTVIPMPINYPGMPASRYWEFEDARVDFGAMAAGRQQLAKLLLIDFALISGDDWFIIPVMVPVGRLCNTHTLKVWDTFGKFDSIESAYSIDSKAAEKSGKHNKELPWSMFQLSFDPPSNESSQFNLFLPPALGTSLNGAPLEEVLLLRDEMANLAWAVERVVEGPLGQAFNRTEDYFRNRTVSSANATTLPSDSTAPLIYRLETEVLPHWISLQPELIGTGPAVWLQPHGDGQGLILKDRKPVHEEEVPREGAYVTRAFQYARWINGETYLWIGRRKGVGRGEGSSGLQFDRLEPPREPDKN